MDTPLCRDPDYIYLVEGYPNHCFWAGTMRDGTQALVVVVIPRIIVIIFDPSGNLREVRELAISAETLGKAESRGTRELFRTQIDAQVSALLHDSGIRESIVNVRRFFLPEYNIGITDFARCFQEVLHCPSAYSEDEQRVADREQHRWLNEGIFELWLNHSSNVWMKSNGQIESS